MPDMQQALSTLEETLQYSFADRSLLETALTHTSFVKGDGKRQTHNERLEFLGDAVLDLIIGEYLFRTYPQMPEGELTKTKAAIVCESSLAQCAGRLHFGDYLLLGHGEDTSGGRTRDRRSRRQA